MPLLMTLFLRPKLTTRDVGGLLASVVVVVVAAVSGLVLGLRSSSDEEG